MSISVGVTMQGDLDNPKHREVAGEIVDAIQAVISKHLGTEKPTKHIVSETKQSGCDSRLFDVEATNEFTAKSAHVEHKLSFYTGFHLNP